jgi:hypothetical protein
LPRLWYYRAEKRGFQNGDPVADWLAAKRDCWKARKSTKHGLLLGGKNSGSSQLTFNILTATYLKLGEEDAAGQKILVPTSFHLIRIRPLIVQP